MGKCVVIGAGPSGISAAWQLALAGEDVVVVESGPQAGGIAQTVRHDDLLIDYGPHAFHIKKRYITQLVKKFSGKNFRTIPTRTHIILRGKRFKYPLEFYDVIIRLDAFFSLKMIADYTAACLINRFKPYPMDSFESWGIKHFGKSLYELCFGKYTQRVWGIPPSQLSYKLAQQKLSKLNLIDVIAKVLGMKGHEQKAYFKQYIYPKYGIGEIFTNMAKAVEDQGGKVLLNSTVTGIEIADNKVNKVNYKDKNNNIKSLGCGTVISTAPIGSLAQMIQPELKPEAIEAGQNLVFRALIIVYFVVKQDVVSDSQWCYLVDEKFTFNRFAEQKNLSPYMMPADKTVVSFEICCNKGDQLWKKTDKELFDLAMEDVVKLNLFKNEQITDSFVARVGNAYPVYDFEFDNRVSTIIDSLSTIDNLISTGRNGLFVNIDMHDSIEMGLMAAKAVAQKNFNSKHWYQEIKRYVDQKII